MKLKIFALSALLTSTLCSVGHAIGKRPITTGLHCTLNLPEDNDGVIYHAYVDINAVNPKRMVSTLKLTHEVGNPTTPGNEPIVIDLPFGDRNETVLWKAAIVANQLSDLKQTKILIIDPAIGPSPDGKSPAEDRNIVMKLKVTYKVDDPNTKKVSYTGSLFYSLYDKSGREAIGGGPVNCTCTDVNQVDNKGNAAPTDCVAAPEKSDD